jgi:hypothetical protein
MLRPLRRPCDPPLRFASSSTSPSASPRSPSSSSLPSTPPHPRPQNFRLQPPASRCQLWPASDATKMHRRRHHCSAASTVSHRLSVPLQLSAHTPVRTKQPANDVSPSVSVASNSTATTHLSPPKIPLPSPLSSPPLGEYPTSRNEPRAEPTLQTPCQAAPQPQTCTSQPLRDTLSTLHRSPPLSQLNRRRRRVSQLSCYNTSAPVHPHTQLSSCRTRNPQPPCNRGLPSSILRNRRHRHRHRYRQPVKLAATVPLCSYPHASTHSAQHRPAPPIRHMVLTQGGSTAVAP